MNKVTYHDHTVEFASTEDTVTGKWSPKATVMFIGLSQTVIHRVQPVGVYDTRVEADEAALAKAKVWIDQGKP